MFLNFQIWLLSNQWFEVAVLCSLLGTLLVTGVLLWMNVSRLIDLMAQNANKRGVL